jgi:hypothetical protein
MDRRPHSPTAAALRHLYGVSIAPLPLIAIGTRVCW